MENNISSKVSIDDCEIESINQVLNLFKEAGLEKEALQLSTTIIKKDGTQIKQTSIGHYIAIVDNMLALDKAMPRRSDNTQRTDSYSDAVVSLMEYAGTNKGPDSELFTQLKDIFYHGKVE